MKIYPPLVAAACFVAAQFLAPVHATSCMVLGEPTAKVKTAEGDRSPVFVTKTCDALRLVSGKAQASWIGRDGKPRMVPITASGVEAAPQAGAEERSVNVVWAELTTKRERQQPAYMRSIGEERPPKFFVPNEGLVLVSRAEVDANLVIERESDGKIEKILDTKISAGSPIIVSSKLLAPDQVYIFKILRTDTSETWRWKTLTQAESDLINTQLTDINQSVAEPEHRLLLQAMLFDQIKVRSNMELTVQQIKALDSWTAYK